MDSSHLDGLKWFRSSKCDAGNCVEVAALDAVVLIRDSADPSSTPLAVSHGVWRDFVRQLRAEVLGGR